MSRDPADREKIERLMEALAHAAKSNGSVYLTGGTSAVLIGWRQSTVDADLRFDPEAVGIFSALPRIKDQLSLNIELASPADFIAVPSDWRENSPFIAQKGPLAFFHFDFRAQALEKIERGHERDLNDVKAMLERGLVSLQQIVMAFEQIEPGLLRFPAIDADVLREKVDAFVAGHQSEVSS
jgi:hypothetical protein